MNENAFSIDDNEGGVALFSFFPCVDHSSYQQNSSENNEYVEVTQEAIMHSNVADLVEIVKNIDKKTIFIGNKIGIINNHVNLIDEKCNMIFEDGEYRTAMTKSFANAFQNMVEEKDDNTSSTKKLSKGFKVEMIPFLKNDFKSKMMVHEGKT